MMQLLSEGDEALSSAGKLWRMKEKKSIKSSIFKLFKLINFEETSGLRQKIKITVESIIWCFQIWSLLWVSDLSIKNWHTNMIIWEIIGYLKLDNTCSMLGIINECFYLSALLAYANFLSIAILVVTIYYSYHLPKILLSIFSATFYFWLKFLLVPSIQICSIFLKYSFLPQTTISEYENRNEIGEFIRSFPLQICTILAIAITFMLSFMQLEFSGEIRHSENKIISAKAHSKIDKHIKIFTFIFPIAYVIFAENYIRHLQILALIFSILLIRETIDLLPYFSIFCNSLIILQLYFIGFISSIFILGDFMDNSMVIIMLAVILGPLTAIFIIQFSLKLQRNFSQTIPTDLTNIESQYILEKSLRYALCSNDAGHKDQIISAFENFFIQKGFNGNKLQAIWAANYCLYTLKEESLAKVKLSKTKHIVDWSLESNYQEYLCQKNISNTCLSESSQFSDYFLQNILVKNEEKQLCINLLMFWSEITSLQPNLQKLKRKLYSIEDEILFLNMKYSQLITKFPNSKSILSLYYSYCRDIIYNAEKSTFLETKLRSIDKELTNFLGDSSKKFSLFNENAGILIISNEDSNFGEILYADQKSAEFLNLQLGSIKNDNISNFIHPYYKEKLKEDLKQFIKYSSSSEMDLTKGFFLTKNAHNLLQLEGKILLTSINGLLVAILAFKPKNVKQEIALLNEEGEIICHSNNFPRYVGKSEGLIGFDLKNLFYNSEDFRLQLNTPYHLSSLKIFLMLSYSEFYKIKIPYVVLANDSREIVMRGNNGSKQGNNEKIQATANYLSVGLLGSINSDKTNSLLYKESEILDDDLKSKMEVHRFSNDDPSKNADWGSERRGSENSVVSIGTHQKKVLSLIKSSSRSINVLHFAFVFSIIAVVAFNIIVLNHAFSNINFISDMSLPINIGKTAKNLQRFTYVSNLYVILQYSSDSITLKRMFDDIVTCLTELENTYLDITTNLNKWNYCSGEDILTGKNLYLWNIDDGIYKKSSLIETIGIFIKFVKFMQGNQILSKINSSEAAKIDDFSFWY
ncbi:unnamed protein product [Blepharisma stoltei]|uniref:TmcB/TmcC TPR repeats domain-containing protein n=1 Tax=Blepharisma stoltei TaxID=1481888 RepID=A0AAU9ISB0_9CILI|nr:unnamed protein product [Blepharisma stoltei]